MPSYVYSKVATELLEGRTNREADKQRMEKYDNKQNNFIDTKRYERMQQNEIKIDKR